MMELLWEEGFTGMLQAPGAVKTRSTEALYLAGLNKLLNIGD